MNTPAELTQSDNGLMDSGYVMPVAGSAIDVRTHIGPASAPQFTHGLEPFRTNQNDPQ